MPETQPQGPTHPDDIRTPGPGGGEQPATIVGTNDVASGQMNRGAYGESPSPQFNEEAQAEKTLYVPKEQTSVAEMRENARDYYEDDTLYVLDAGTELYSKSGARVVLRSPAVISLDSPSGDPRAGDIRFAGFLHDSDTNWQLNIGQLERAYNRATAAPLPLMCVKHGEDIEDAPYGKPRQCPKCAAEALADAEAKARDEHVAAEAARLDAQRQGEIKAGDKVIATTEELKAPAFEPTQMCVLSVEFGTANCEWFVADARQERTFPVSSLIKV